MRDKETREIPEMTTPYRLIGLIVLWIFILLWIAPLASFASLVAVA